MAQDRWIYNGKDCIATALVFAALEDHLNERTRRVYEAEMGLQGVCLGVQMRGLRVDATARRGLLKEFKDEIRAKEREIDRIVGRPLNPRSPDQVKAFMYGELGLSVQKKHGKVTTDEKALQRIAKRTVAVIDGPLGKERTRRKDLAAQVASLILETRAISKQKGALSAVTEKGKHRGVLSVGGTESFRFSSHKNPFGKGINLQNPDKRLRRIYTSDPGYVLGQADQERAESMVVAYASNDEGYIRAHLKGNTHVTVARLIWPDAGWTGESEKDERIAKEPRFIGTKSKYDLAKNIQHGLNYLLTPDGLSRYANVPVVEARRIYKSYFNAFPGIPLWHQSVIDEVRETGRIIYPGGYERQFFGRRNDRATWREAISSIPQSIIAWINHIAFLRVYYTLDGEEFQLLNHIHDALLFQARDPKAIEPRLRELLVIKWEIRGRIMQVPWEIKWGKNWSELS